MPAELDVDFALDWGDEIQMRRAEVALQRALRTSICAEAYPGESTPPFVAHVYLSGNASLFLGTVAHPSRWPQLPEIAAALREWRPAMTLKEVTWAVEPDASASEAGPYKANTSIGVFDPESSLEALKGKP